jgi:hypothetical protein
MQHHTTYVFWALAADAARRFAVSATTEAESADRWSIARRLNLMAEFWRARV